MSYETLPVTPQRVIPEEPLLQLHTMDFESGDSTSWPQHHLSLRRWGFEFAVSTADEREELEAFLRHHKGATTPFEHELPANNPLPRPYIGPTVQAKAGGSVGARTLYVAHSFSDGTYETPVCFSPISVDLAATETMVVTCRPFPLNVTEAYVYVGTSLGALHKQATAIAIPSDGWTEPATGYDTGGAAPAADNSFLETVLLYADEDTLSVTKLQHNAWGISCRVCERWPE